MRALIPLFALVLLFLLTAPSMPLAQAETLSTGTTLESGAPASAASAASPWGSALAWLQRQQRDFHRALAERLRVLSRDASPALVWSLIVASLLYGVFHAAGPGHGKAVIAAYLLSHRELLGRALWLALAGAFCQGLAALILVYGLVYLAGWVPRDTQAAVSWSERVSFLLLIVIGALLALRALRALARLARPRLATVEIAGSYARRDDDRCNHSHGPSPGQVAAAGDFKTAAGVVLSIGLRPCSGAIVVLVFAQVLAIPWAGIGAVVAMSAGTATTVAVIALLVLGARNWTGRLLSWDGRGGATAAALDASLLALAGGLAILAIGLSLLLASTQAPHPLGL